MPKLKTHKGAYKRFHLTGTGKLMHVKGMKSHLRLNKAKREKRLFDETIPLHKSHVRLVKRLLPNGTK